jgi:hypothetical protein
VSVITAADRVGSCWALIAAGFETSAGTRTGQGNGMSAEGISLWASRGKKGVEVDDAGSANHGAIRLHTPGVDGLRYATIETPSLRLGEALVEVLAAAITPR